VSGDAAFLIDDSVVPESPFLEIELIVRPYGCVARLTGDLIGETMAGLWGIESILINEVETAFDFSAVRTIDGAGLEAVLQLMNVVRSMGRRLSIGSVLRAD